MILRTSFNQLFLSLFLFTAFTAAWPWPPSFADIEGYLLRRDDSNSDSSASPSATQPPSAAASSGQTPSQSGSAAATSGAPTTSDDSKSNTNTQTPTGSGSATKPAQTGSKNTAKNTASATSATITAVDPRLPAGGVNMLTPAALATSTYYKIGEPVTFGWNYTSLSIPPAKIDVLVTCSANNALYTLSNNVSFASSGSVEWDTLPEETGTAPLLTGEYNLIIHDAARDPSAVAPAGELGGFSALPFGMYLRQSYTPRSDWVCAVCSAALSDTERQALKFMFAMAGITVLSFTWFVGGLGAFV